MSTTSQQPVVQDRLRPLSRAMWEGKDLMARKRYEEAVTAFSEVLQQDSEYVLAYQLRADSLRYLGRAEEANRDIETAFGITKRRSFDSFTPKYSLRTDDVGALHYVISWVITFPIVFGLVGLTIQYYFRDRGWLAVGINAALLVGAIVAMFALALANPE